MEENTENKQEFEQYKNFVKLKWCLLHAVECFQEAEDIR